MVEVTDMTSSREAPASGGLVSVTIPAYNNQETVAQCLESLVRQKYQPVEVIVVDDGSTDGTPSKVEQLSQIYKNLRLVREEHAGPSHARNIGIRESLGQYLLFADADAIYSKDYLSKGISTMSNDPSIGAVCVTGTIWVKKNTFVSRGIALEYEMKQRYLKEGKWKPYFAFLYRKDAVLRVGGFDEELFQSEDKDLFGRVKSSGYRIGLVDGFNWIHLYPQDVRSLVVRGYRGGKQRVVFLAKKRMYGELLRRTVGLWGLVALIILSMYSSLVALGTLVCLILGYVAKSVQTISQAWGKGKRRDMLLLPLVSVIRYLATAVGYTKGSFTYAIRKGRRLKTSWSDL